MYGPPPDPRQVIVDAPLWAWLACALVGVALCAWARPQRRFLWVLGATVALTTPAAAMIPTAVWGAWPTIDKTGSLLFYGRGVQWFQDLDALRLIGVHVGHLWITAAFDLFLSPFAAQNAQALLNVGLSWYVAAVLFEDLGARRTTALAAALPFGLGLHVFRDINWYTIEKSGVYWLPLYVLALRRNWRVTPLIYAAAFFYNVYWGVLCAFIGAAALYWRPRAVILSAVAALPLVGAQWRLMHGQGSIGSPELFLEQRAALDVWTPLAWNRLEAWRALDPVCLALGLWGLRKQPLLAAFVVVAALLALGPVSPLYMLLWHGVPGFWRFAKPEVFFELSWLGILAAAALQERRWLLPVVVLTWLVSVRTHPVYPGFSEYIPASLPKSWQEAVPGMGGGAPDKLP